MFKKDLYTISAAMVTLVFLVMFFPVMGTAADQSFVPTPPILNNIPPAWSQTLQCDTEACPRFELVMGGVAVLDHETGLVWERYVDGSLRTWAGAINQCNYQMTGLRGGWHLPTVEQLMSLRQGHQGIVPKLPLGHPFSNFPFDAPYWTATTVTGVPSDAWQVNFGSVAPPNAQVEAVKDTPESGYMWCVRGGQTVNHDQ